MVELLPGDTLFLYTDGLTEAQSASGEEFGDSRLHDVLTSVCRHKPGVLSTRSSDLCETSVSAPKVTT
jgi:serine phosphatase RsbU (regulator of sigma subunit)